MRALNLIAFKLIVAGVYTLSSMGAYATVYTTAINASTWKLNASVFACEMTHEVPYFGQAVFRTRAGEASAFYLKGQTSRFKAGQASLVAHSPIWVSPASSETLAEVPVKQGTRPMWLKSNLTELMLARLNAGMQIELTRKQWFEKEKALSGRLTLSNIGFRETYESYLSCLGGLIPRNFDQLKRTSLRFPAGELDELPVAITTQLDYVLKLVKHDDKVRAFYIDGHTDSLGDRDENLELSKLRAELVQQYLVRRGIPEEWITLRWHGERYPVTSNGTAAGRAKNRRVTVRLERIEQIEVLPLASNSQ